jgi:hypothetical protein
MTEALLCPSCNAPLDYEDGDDDPVVDCNYCNTPVILPASLREQAPVGADQLPGFSGLSEQAWQLKKIVRLARSNRKIEAVKLYRETFHVGLKEAKEGVEQLAAPPSLNLSSANFKIDPVVDEQIGRAASCTGKIMLVSFVGVVALFIGIVAIFLLTNPFGQSSSLLPDSFATAELSFGGEGTGAGLFDDARQVGVEGDGNIYVGEYSEGRVQVFNAAGEFISLWTFENETPVTGMAVDRSGTVYIIHSGQLFLYDGSSGEMIGEWVHPEGWGFDHVAATADGGLAVSWQKHSDDIVRFDSQGNITLIIQEAISSVSGDSELNTYVAVDGFGNIYALGTFNDGVYVFTPEGKFTTRFGGSGDEPGQLRAANAIAVDGQSRVYVSDIKGIQVFDKDGRYLDTIKVQGAAFGLGFDDQNHLFVVTNHQEVTRYIIKK